MSTIFEIVQLLFVALSTTFSLHYLHVVEVASDCCNMLTIIFKFEAHQKSSTKHHVRSENGLATSMTMWSIENERARKLDTSNEVNILRMKKLVKENFSFSELSDTFFHTSDLSIVSLLNCFFSNHPTKTDRIQVWRILFQPKNQYIRLILFDSIFVSIVRINIKIFYKNKSEELINFNGELLFIREQFNYIKIARFCNRLFIPGVQGCSVHGAHCWSSAQGPPKTLLCHCRTALAVIMIRIYCCYCVSSLGGRLRIYWLRLSSA